MLQPLHNLFFFEKFQKLKKSTCTRKFKKFWNVCKFCFSVTNLNSGIVYKDAPSGRQKICEILVIKRGPESVGNHFHDCTHDNLIRVKIWMVGRLVRNDNSSVGCACALVLAACSGPSGCPLRGRQYRWQSLVCFRVDSCVRWSVCAHWLLRHCAIWGSRGAPLQISSLCCSVKETVLCFELYLAPRLKTLWDSHFISYFYFFSKPITQGLVGRAGGAPPCGF